MTLHLRHVLKCSLVWSVVGAGEGWTLGTVTMSPEGAGTLARHSALSNLVLLSPVPLAAAAVLAQAGVVPWLAGQGESPPWSRCCCCHAVTRCHAVSRSHQPPPPGRGRAGLGPAAAARQLQRDLRLDYAGRQNIAARQFFVLWKINIRYQLIGRLRTEDLVFSYFPRKPEMISS